MRAPTSHPYVRIVTPVQADEATWQVLELGAAMAKELRAELRALFLTDAQALAAAALPVTRTISYQTGIIRSLDVRMLEAAYRVRAQRVRERLAELCRTEALRWSFAMAEHFEATGILAPSGTGEPPRDRLADNPNEPPSQGISDLLLLDPRSFTVQHQVLPLLHQLTRHTLVGLWDRHAPKPDRVVLFSKGEPNALLPALAIAQSLGVELEIWVYGAEVDERAARSAAIAQWLTDQHSRAMLHEVETGDSNACRHLLRGQANALVLFDSPEIVTAAFGQ